MCDDLIRPAEWSQKEPRKFWDCIKGRMGLRRKECYCASLRREREKKRELEKEESKRKIEVHDGEDFTLENILKKKKRFLLRRREEY